MPKLVWAFMKLVAKVPQPDVEKNKAKCLSDAIFTLLFIKMTTKLLTDQYHHDIRHDCFQNTDKQINYN